MGRGAAGLQEMQRQDVHPEGDGQFGKILKVEIVDIRVHVTMRFHFEVSPLADVPQSDPQEFDCRVIVKPEEPPEGIPHPIRIGDKTCYFSQSLNPPAKVNSSATLNGQPLELGVGG
jgi:hypothetical protein